MNFMGSVQLIKQWGLLHNENLKGLNPLVQISHLQLLMLHAIPLGSA